MELKLWADNKYHNHQLDGWVSKHGWYAIEVERRPPGSGGFRVIKWRWVVERTFAWLGRCRIHSRDYERKTSSSEAQVQISMIQLMLRRLSGEKHEAPFRSVILAHRRALLLEIYGTDSKGSPTGLARSEA